MKELVPIGIIIILVGFIIAVIGALSSAKSADTSSKVAVGGFIGFIPFGFANDKKLLYIIIGVTAAAIIAWIIFNLTR